MDTGGEDETLTSAGPPGSKGRYSASQAGVEDVLSLRTTRVSGPRCLGGPSVLAS